MHDEDDDLPLALRAGTRLLREPPTVREEWRRQVVSQVQRNRSHWTRRTWSVNAVAAVAAGIACIAAGAIAATAVRRSSTPSATVAQMPASAERAASESVQSVRFDLVAPGAARVSIAGDFNQWNPATLPMHRSADGRTWEIEVRLPPGRYTYGFVVDGHVVRDPSAPQAASDDFGVPNSVLLVSRTGGAL